jgi:hypothetical protein
MPAIEEVLAREICECGSKTVADAIEIFQESGLPCKKAKKLVTECDKRCCHTALITLYAMVESGNVDYDEIERLIQLHDDKYSEHCEGTKHG